MAGWRKKVQEIKHGDYVLATKYTDGDPKDHFCVGFFAGECGQYATPRYDIIDSDGKLFRGNGFRRVKKISKERGEFILRNAATIEQGSKSVWWWARCKMDN